MSKVPVFYINFSTYKMNLEYASYSHAGTLNNKVPEYLEKSQT